MECVVHGSIPHGTVEVERRTMIPLFRSILHPPLHHTYHVSMGLLLLAYISVYYVGIHMCYSYHRTAQLGVGFGRKRMDEEENNFFVGSFNLLPSSHSLVAVLCASLRVSLVQ